jgi:hypothetical protein
MNKLKVLIITIITLSQHITIVKAQTNVPYTRYALGTLFNPEFTNLKGWGSLSAAYHSPFNINFANPASYSEIKLTTLDVAGFGSILKLRSTDTAAIFGDGSVSNIALAFPLIKNKAGLATGIIPYSRVNYAISQMNDSIAGIGESFNLFQGQGGLYRFFAGGGYRIKQFAIGVNVSYLFGSISYSDILFFPDAINAYNTRKQESRNFGDFMFDGGIQYRFLLGKNKTYALDFGVAGGLKTNLATKRNAIYDRFIYIISNIPIPDPIDTIYSSTNEKGDVLTPGYISAGLIFSKLNNYSIGINYKYASWSQYRSFGATDLTTDSWLLSAGGEVTPNNKAYEDYWKTISYRLGIQYGINYIQFNDKELRQTAISIGAGFPLRRTFSQLSLAGEWINTGSLKDNPLALSFFTLTAGVTLNDRWFQKRKFE